MRENQLPVNYTSVEETGRVRPAADSGDDSKLGTWLLASAVISVTTLCTICNPKWVSSFVAQTGKISSNSASAVQPKGETAIYGVTRNSVVRGVRPAAPETVQHHGSSSGAHRTLASDRDETSKAKKGFLVPPPPPTPCVLPPEFGFFSMQPAQLPAAPQQQLQQAQEQASPKSHNQAAAQENSPEQSDQELQAADQELQAALRSSLRTVGEWTR